MPLFLSMLPIYLLGNLHCIGMCGPLVMMIGQHRYRYFYFAGRLLGFSLAGLLAGGLGAVLDLFLQRYHISAAASFLFGGMMVMIGIVSLMNWQMPKLPLGGVSQWLSLLLLRDQIWPTFLFGFFTILLPCGQTLLVFSAVALYGDPIIGLFNGFAFALLTSPSLYLAMHAHRFLKSCKQYYNTALGICAIMVGFLALCRGCADLGWIDHLVVNHEYHIVMF